MKHIIYKYFILTCISIGLNGITSAQTIDDYYVPKTSPVSPQAYSFLKYGEIPVDAYTGVPNISVPLYNIKYPSIEVPIELRYHSGGIKVTDEASWTGLGWDINFGSIIQIINDKDDLDGNVEKILPDYHASTPYYSEPAQFPWPYDYPNSAPATGYTPSNDEISLDHYSYWHFTDGYVPEDGNYYNNHKPCLFDSQDCNDYPNYINKTDSEPDVFKAIVTNQSAN